MFPDMGYRETFEQTLKSQTDFHDNARKFGQKALIVKRNISFVP